MNAVKEDAHFFAHSANWRAERERGKIEIAENYERPLCEVALQAGLWPIGNELVCSFWQSMGSFPIFLRS